MQHIGERDPPKNHNRAPLIIKKNPIVELQLTFQIHVFFVFLTFCYIFQIVMTGYAQLLR